MSHVDAETLALLALGERAGSSSDTDHLASCAECARTLNDLTLATEIGRTTIGTGELQQPAPRVWSAISSELGLGSLAVPEVPATGSVEVVRPVRDLAEHRRSRRRVLPMLLAAASVAALVGGGAVAWQSLQPAPETVVARATLAPLPDWGGASGSAVLEQAADGSREVSITVTLPQGERDGFHEVWLMTPDVSALVSLGVLSGTSGTFALPDGIDLDRFDVVDVSSEPLDGDPTHSGDSIVRGSLGSA